MALNIPFIQIEGLIVLVSFHKHMHRRVCLMVLVSFHKYMHRGVRLMVLASFHKHMHRRVRLIVLVSFHKEMHTQPCGTEYSSNSDCSPYGFGFISKTYAPVSYTHLTLPTICSV